MYRFNRHSSHIQTKSSETLPRVANGGILSLPLTFGWETMILWMIFVERSGCKEIMKGNKKSNIINNINKNIFVSVLTCDHFKILHVFMSPVGRVSLLEVAKK